MVNNKESRLTDFLDANPSLKVKFLGWHHDNNWRSRINDGWYECDEFWIEFDDLIEFLKSL